MGSPVLTAVSVLVCAHGIAATPIPGNPRVMASGVPILCARDPVIVNACPPESPCIMLRLAESARVRASGCPLAIATTAMSIANGLPATIVATQQRVTVQ